MITQPVQAAVEALQQRALRTHDVYELDRIERAIDELLRNPEKDAPAPYQIRSAMANAHKVLRARRTAVPTISLEAAQSAPDADDAGTADATGCVDIIQWLKTTSRLSPVQRDLLSLLAAGYDAESIAHFRGQPTARVREQISRARLAARQSYQMEVVAG